MEIRRYHLTREHNSYVLVVYLDPQLEEYSRTLGESAKKKRSLKQQINLLIKDNFPQLNISATKEMIGTALVATMYIGPAHL